MASGFHSGLEPARQDYPEVTHVSHGYGHQYNQQPPQPYYSQPYDPPAVPAPKLEPSATPAPPPSSYGGQTVASPFNSDAQPVAAQHEPQSGTGRTIFGCSLLVFILSCIVAILSAAVIGLAAATGIESQRASSASSSLAALSASVASAASATASAPGTTSTAVGVIDDGCSTNPSSVDKTLYTSFSLLGALKFTRYCDKDAPNDPLLSLFTANFGTCMDACAAYTKYVTPDMISSGNSTDANATCEAVSFIPAWTNKLTAERGGAPGNCYLKGGPQNETGLKDPDIGVDCHAAIFTPGA
ncbi:uncharacterized protein B0H64DRAFT_443950 [Chaetomium fimeti]|jgi:hypothetical protein|uniref:Uncharacterized protein n=1 Tax=Chaetomium fimeti TaxID=1854472 RepID=A0AAE0LRA0_9PEZI|nr:hypothetical protein B0H64DRAFT_443950 [Chaetomium fimeti]